MIDQLIAALGIELELSAKEIADTIWLALQMQQAEPVSTPSSQEDQTSNINPENAETKSSEKLDREKSKEPQKKTSEKSTDNQQKEKKAGIYPQNRTKHLELSFKVPDAPSLREPLTLARALKPLMRRVPSSKELVLDKAATIQRIADEGIWIPILRPTLEPWLDLELVVDEGISMQIWRRTITELERLLKNYGIFRDVRVWGMISDNEQHLQILRGIGLAAQNQCPRSPGELIDPSGRRLVLVVSDCVSPIWRNGVVTSALKIWANSGPTAIVQMLPKWLWPRTALGRASEVRLRGLTPGVPNQQLMAKEVSLWDEIDEETGIKVPVFTLEPDKSSTWAQMLSGKGSIWASGFVFKLDSKTLVERSGLLNISNSELTAEQRVQAFRVTASPMARKLAGLLASAPVISLPIVRLIRETLLKESQQVHVAEVFLGGLLKPLSEINVDTNPDYVQYDFMDGVRELLVDSVPSTYVLNVVDEVSKFVAKRAGLSLEEFAAVLKNPRQITDSKISLQVRPFAMVTAQVLRRLGGEYAEFAEELEKSNNMENIPDQPTDINIPFENLDGQVPLDSPFYIERPPIEKNCYNAILKTGALIRIKAPRQMGKSSLMARILHHAAQSGYRIASLNFQLVDDEFLANLDQFLQWFCASLSAELNLPERLADYWKVILGSKNKCTNYFHRYLLSTLENPLALGLDEVDRIFAYPQIAHEFLALLRSWHERSKNDRVWQKLRLVIFHSQELDIPLNVNKLHFKSPFNVGSPIIELGEFSPEQVRDLVQRHGLNWSDTEIKKLMAMVDGHPYLLRAALYNIATHQLTLDQFLAIAPTEEGLYGDHLYRHLLILEENQNLKTAMSKVVQSQKPIKLNPIETFKLKSMGLVKLRGNEVIPLCDLYRLYFGDRLNQTYQYQYGGSLATDALTYITREADEQLYQFLKAGKFCYVLNSRQMGKSSLRVRVMKRLQEEDNFACVAIDLTNIGSLDVTPEIWYANILDDLIYGFKLEDTVDLGVFLEKYENLSPVKWLGKFIDEILLREIQQNIVIFIDEIDSTLSLNFKADDFFALIRSFYNRRVDNDAYTRLDFVLLGVATPADLIQDKTHTPFNIGYGVELTGFTLEEALPLASKLSVKTNQPQRLLELILNWTGGQPFLTQKICNLVLASSNSSLFNESESYNSSLGNGGKGSIPAQEWLENLIRSNIIENWQAQDKPEHLRTIERLILIDKQLAGELLDIYQKIYQQGELVSQNTIEEGKLQLSGLVVKRNNQLQIYNQIYREVFNQQWIDNQLAALRPYSE